MKEAWPQLTAIDVHEKRRLLGIDYDDYTEAVKLTGRMIFDAIDSGTYGVDAYMFWSSGILTGNQTRVIGRYDAASFWSSGILTGNQTIVQRCNLKRKFWSSGILTGNQTQACADRSPSQFWSSGILTGNQTWPLVYGALGLFWSSGILTGNQTSSSARSSTSSFGAVAF